MAALPDNPPITHPLLKPDGLMSQTGRQVLAYHVGVMEANEAGTVAGDDIEALHDMRVATRRMRAVMRMVEGYYQPDVTQPLIEHMRAVRQALGPVRDVDVLLEHIYQSGSRSPDLIRHLQAMRIQRRAVMIGYLNSPPYRMFKDEMRVFVTVNDDDRALDDRPRIKRVSAAVPALIYRQCGRLRAYQGEIDQLSLDDLHRLRIVVKRFRYGLETFESVLGEECGPIIMLVKEVQDHLGVIRDRQIAVTLIHDAMPDDRLSPAARVYLERRRAEIKRRQESAPQLYEQIVSAAIRRQLAQAVSIL